MHGEELATDMGSVMWWVSLCVHLMTNVYKKAYSGGVSTVLSNVYIFFLQLPLIALVFLIIALPIFLNRELFHDDELLTKFAYVISLIFTLLLNFKKFKKWQNEFKHKYLIKCTNCSVLNEIPQFLGQRRELFFLLFFGNSGRK